jgi:glycosyltransferase involved in cell wall biosynthesis
MKKFLYITDREEYSEHNFIGPLFEKYLPEFLDVDIVYFSKYKSYFENRKGHFIVPIYERKDILKYLTENGVDVFAYDYVVVRNIHDILENILASKDMYNIKVGYRLSFPKITVALERAKVEQGSTLIKSIDAKLKTHAKLKLINQCDIFLPTSKRMQEVYYPEVTTKIHVVPSAIDPSRVHSKISRGDEKIVFTYIGTLSKLRNFELILEAFNSLKSENWELLISTVDVDYAQNCVKEFLKIKDKIKIIKSDTKDQLLDELAHCDVGVALLPDIDIFRTSVPLKIIDYYTSGIPALISNNELNNTVFENNKDAWICDFDQKSITNKLEEIIANPKDKIREMGKSGQQKLLDTRNYQDVAKNLAKAMEEL